MKHFKKNCVLVPIDKAPNNVPIISKRYYVEVILNKISVIGHRNSTYAKANKSCNEMIDESTQYTKRLGFKTTEKEKTLPNMYWIPKIHKNPTGARFIIASKISPTKQISESSSKAFKLIYSKI